MLGADIGRWTLRFADKQIERDFRAYRLAKSLFEIRAWSIAAVVFFAMLDGFEWLVLGKHLKAAEPAPKTGAAAALIRRKMVGAVGIEPTTPTMSP